MEFVEYPSFGRLFEAQRKVRLGDATTAGRLRLDALMRYAQDVSDDDTSGMGLPDDPIWVVRSSSVQVETHAQLSEKLTFSTFCSGIGSRWAERRLTVAGSYGAKYEISVIWICVDRASLKPTRLTDQFLSIYGQSANNRKVNTKSTIVDHSTFDQSKIKQIQWNLRTADFDVMSHMNNAAYWSVIENYWISADSDTSCFVKIEYGKGVEISELVEIKQLEQDNFKYFWWITDKKTAAKAVYAQGDL